MLWLSPPAHLVTVVPYSERLEQLSVLAVLACVVPAEQHALHGANERLDFLALSAPPLPDFLETPVQITRG
jgi:hypothetical protein